MAVKTNEVINQLISKEILVESENNVSSFTGDVITTISGNFKYLNTDAITTISGNFQYLNVSSATINKFKGIDELAVFETTATVGRNYLRFKNETNNLGYIGYGSLANNNFIISNEATSSNILIYTNKLERIRIDNSGNVGIGNSSPGQLLDVRTSTATLGEGARIGEARLGTYINNTYYAAFAHNSLYSNAGSYAVAQGILGDTYLNAATGQNIYFRTNNVDKAIILDNGNVGIGTTSPATKLDVNGIISINGTAVINENNNQNDIWINSRVIRNNSSVNQDGMYIGYNNTGGSGGHLRFYANGTTERMRIDASNGNVGIGTASPSAKLTLSSPSVTTTPTAISLLDYDNSAARGRLILNNSSSNFAALGNLANGSIFLGYTSNDTGLTVSSTPFVVTTAGNVGIGTSSPTAKLNINAGTEGQGSAVTALKINGPNSPTNANSAQDIEWSFTAAGSSKIRSYRLGTWGTNIEFLTNSNIGGNNAQSRMIIDSEGLVGIGTTSPSSKLNVNAGVFAINGESGDPTSYTGGGLALGNYSAGSYKWIQSYDGQKLRINPLGNTVEIGGTTTFQTSVRFANNTWNLSDTDSRNRLYFQTNSTTYFGSGNGYVFRNSADNVDLVTIQNGGNVGIGTSSPEQKLDVRGNVRIGDGVSTEQDINFINVSGNWQVGINNDGNGTDNNQFYVYQNGQYRLTVQKNTGNVGIGTSGPSTKLHISGGSGLTIDTINNIWASFGANVPGASYMTLRKPGSANAIGYIGCGGGGSITTATTSTLGIRSEENLYFASQGDNVRMVISGTNGNVGIGTSGPITRLDVITNASTKFASSFGASISINDWTGIHFGYREDNNFYRKSGIVFERLDSAARGKIHILNNHGNDNTNATLSDAKITISSSGEVGIGTSSPSYTLAVTGTLGVSGNTNVSGTIISSRNDIETILQTKNTSASSANQLYVKHNLGDIDMGNARGTITISTGSVAIGGGTYVTPTQTLDVNGTVRVRTFSSTAAAGTVYRLTDGTLSLTAPSDIRFKKDITKIDNVLERIQTIRGIRFKWDDTRVPVTDFGIDPPLIDKWRIGVIAQEMEAAFPELVFQHQEGKDYLGVSYPELSAVLLEAVKELKKENDDLRLLLLSIQSKLSASNLL